MQQIRADQTVIKIHDQHSAPLQHEVGTVRAPRAAGRQTRWRQLARDA
jgi:hypothetical protein